MSLDGVADFLANVLMGADAFTGELVAGLGHAELVGGELGGIHAVHQVFLFRNALPRLNVVTPEPPVQALIPGVVEHAEHLILDTRLLGGAGQGLELFARLLTQLQPFEVGGRLVGEFLAASLDGEVFLRLGDLGFAWVPVLGDEVAGEAGEVVVLNHVHRPLSAGDRFAPAK